MPRRTKPTAESRASSDTPGDAYRLAELIDLQHQLLLGFATGTIDMAAASGAFGEAQEEIRAICGRLGAIRPPFPWGSLEAWKWEAKGFEDAADIDARLGQYRSQGDVRARLFRQERDRTAQRFLGLRVVAGLLVDRPQNGPGIPIRRLQSDNLLQLRLRLGEIALLHFDHAEGVMGIGQ